MNLVVKMYAELVHEMGYS